MPMKSINLPCGSCGGSGRLPCGHCNGTGCYRKGSVVYGECYHCHGKGQFVCSPCGGTGIGTTVQILVLETLEETLELLADLEEGVTTKSYYRIWRTVRALLEGYKYLSENLSAESRDQVFPKEVLDKINALRNELPKACPHCFGQGVSESSSGEVCRDCKGSGLAKVVETENATPETKQRLEAEGELRQAFRLALDMSVGKQSVDIGRFSAFRQHKGISQERARAILNEVLEERRKKGLS